MKNIELIIWDLDGVIYPMDDKFIQAFWDGSQKVIQHFLGTDDAASLAIAQQSWKTYHSGYDVLFKEYGKDQMEVFHVFHENMNEDFVQPVSPDFLDQIKQCNVQHCALTHGNKSWAKRTLAKSNMISLFQEDDIFCVEDIWPHKKSNSKEPFVKVLNKHGYPAHLSMMVEDTQINLMHAKQLQIHTSLIDIKQNAIQEHYTDNIFVDKERLIGDLLQLKLG